MAIGAFLRDHPDLYPFLLSNATGEKIGKGSYGNVEEVAIPGAVCAAKTIHNVFQDPDQVPLRSIKKVASEFVSECLLLSTLRHPHIVQFLGVCSLPGSQMPALVMEKLVKSLHDVLDPEPPSTTKPYIPDSLKCSILQNVAGGLAFLHSHSPPIIHRDLSAKNVLLTKGMVAKIADLGMARIMPHLRGAATMTKTPGASIYMPPEALEDESKYDASIDIFSLGVVALFTLSQIFPKPLAATFVDDNGKVVGRSELERRGNCMWDVLRQFSQGHPFVHLIQQCLKNSIKERPTIHQVQLWLDDSQARINDNGFDVHKLSLVQVLQSKNMIVQEQREKLDTISKENAVLRAQLASLRDAIHSLHDGRVIAFPEMARSTTKSSFLVSGLQVRWCL